MPGCIGAREVSRAGGPQGRPVLHWPSALVGAMMLAITWPATLVAQYRYRIIYPEQRWLEVGNAGQVPPWPLPASEVPPTVSRPPTGDTRYFSLDEAIQTSLANARVVRVLAGVSAVTSGRTIYDAAVTGTTIDQALGRFDPFLQVSNHWDRLDLPSALFADPSNPLAGSTLAGTVQDRYRLNVAVTKDNPLGGQWGLGVSATRQLFPDTLLPLNPQTTSSATLSYTQPLLSGFGMRANLAPVVLARINTEISFFQLKEAVQQNVRDVIAAYWNLVAARTAAWARRRQVEQAEFAYRRAEALFRAEIESGANAAQARSSLAQFRAQLIAAEASVLQQEAALRNLLGLPPWDRTQIVPTSEPMLDRFEPDWQQLVDLAASRRPDLIELKLVLEADQQQILLANNRALPQLDGVALYRWNGLEGEMPTGNGLASRGGQFTDWTLGVNFSVPIGLRQARAQLRQRELLLARDRAHLEQALHAAVHLLATTLRSLDQAYEQYLAFKEAREAARINLDRQLAEFTTSRVPYINVLIAITDWGNAMTSEATAAAQYNTLLAELELQTGTILETHGVRFYEERYGSIGPLGRLSLPVCYPQATPPSLNEPHYPPGQRPAENVFDLEDPARFRITPRPTEELPPPMRQPLDLPPPVPLPAPPGPDAPPVPGPPPPG